MAASALTVQSITRAGLNPSYTAANVDGNYFANDGKKVFLHVFNGDASPHTVTLDIQTQVDGQAVTDPTVSVPASEDRMIGPFPVAWYGDPVNVTYDAVTSVTVGVIRIP